MARTVQVSTVMASEVPGTDGCFIVEALRTVDRAWIAHHGPRDFGFFTEAEAVRLATQVRYVGMIDPDHWEDVSANFDDLADRWDHDAMAERIGQLAA